MCQVRPSEIGEPAGGILQPSPLLLVREQALTLYQHPSLKGRCPVRREGQLPASRRILPEQDFQKGQEGRAELAGMQMSRHGLHIRADVIAGNDEQEIAAGQRAADMDDEARLIEIRRSLPCKIVSRVGTAQRLGGGEASSQIRRGCRCARPEFAVWCRICG